MCQKLFSESNIVENQKSDYYPDQLKRNVLIKKKTKTIRGTLFLDKQDRVELELDQNYPFESQTKITIQHNPYCEKSAFKKI